MKRTISMCAAWVLALLVAHGMGYAQLIIDHTSVDEFDKIPDYYISEAKKMWVNFPGESHSSGYRRGCTLLYQQTQPTLGDKYKALEQTAYVTDALRMSGTPGAGEASWYTWYAANPNQTSSIKTHIYNSNSNNLWLTSIGFGWCWDMYWQNGPGGGIDPVYQVRWAGSSESGPQGSMRWGLDAEDTALTGNSVNLDTYLQATQSYTDYCAANNFPTKVVFTTGTVDGYSGENGFQGYLKNERIRNFVKADFPRIIFDYADILSYNNSGQVNLVTWTRGSEFGSFSGTQETYPMIHPDNMKDLNGGYVEDGDHIGQVGAIRLAKAEWVLAAKLAGWDKAYFYIRAGATGNGSGSDWTNAYPDFPATMIRGATYYVASGNYGPHTFNTPVSGTSLITIKGAVASDHGTDVGWSSAMGVDTAPAIWGFGSSCSNTFPGCGALGITTSYWLIDGSVGSGANKNSYGFTLATLSCNIAGPQIHALWGGGSHITFKHFSLVGCGQGTDNEQQGLTYGNSGQSAITDNNASFLYLENWQNAIVLYALSNATFEYIYHKAGVSTANHHGGSIDIFSTSNIIFRYNIMDGCNGTACLDGNIGTPTVMNNWDIYGNVFQNATIGNGIIAGIWNGIANTRVYNNTFANNTGGAWFFEIDPGFCGTSCTGGNVLYNNLIWNSTCGIAQNDGAPIAHDYNTYFSCSGAAPSETHGQIATSNLFVNSAAGNYHLAAATQAGAVMVSPYNIDPDGVPRGADGIWDRGAYEYVVSTILYGDVSENGSVTAYDASLAAQYAVGLITLTSTQVTKADVSGNGSVSAYDASLIAQYAVGLITKFPVEGLIR